MGEPNKNGEKRVRRRKDGTFDVGNGGGPGRPKGSISIKDLVRQHLEENPNDLKEFVSHFIKKNRELAWQMLEGRPSQGIGQADDLEALPPVLVKFLDDGEDNRNPEGV